MSSVVQSEATESLTSAKSESKPKRKWLIRKAGVLGAGNMGSRIAAHFANAGLPVVLLDVASAGPGEERSKVARNALNALKSAKPAAFFEADLARRITTGNFEDDLELLRDCDWIVEAVAEDLEIKRNLLRKVAPFRAAYAIVTTNTSGLPIEQIAEEMDSDFRRHWFGTHFFNPPRYMQLLEIIPGRETDPGAVEAITSFAEKRLGKTVVRAKDTPNFIGNRIGIFVLLNAIRVMQQMALTIEQVDALTGAVLGWPKTGTFRLSDLVGIDVFAHVAKNFFERVKDERSDLQLPDFLQKMLANGWLGDKTRQGFYKKVRGENGEEVRLALDWKTLDYRAPEKPKFPALEIAKNAGTLPERLKLLLSGDARKDQTAAFYWQILPELWNYSAFRIGEIADDLVSIDRAMKAGFNWELGPFEMWDAAGVPGTVERMRAAGIALAPAVEKLLESGKTSWYRNDSYFDVTSGEYRPMPHAAGAISIARAKASRGVVRENPGASLVDIGDGVACIEFHTKMNAIGTDILTLTTQALDPAGEAVANFDAFVVANEGGNFSAGANLMQLLLAMQEQEWDEIELVIRSFQKMTQAIKFCPRPVVVAPFNLCLGGGSEVSLHGAARQAYAELYMGLVETGVGLIPAGGGCKEVVLRAIERAGTPANGGASDTVELMDFLRGYFETIAMAKVSTSAFEAHTFGFLKPGDGITFNRERLLEDAKARALELAGAGYAPPAPREDIPAPGENALATLRMGVRLLREAEYISDHDVTVANRLAYVLCGGNVTPGTPLSEQYFLDLELEGFLALCGETKTAERIAHTLQTGKPLRN
ncbi:MAG TPA: 3-hydroxyacyl-CoA dehydrogenase/enoyl-CoA hydratase family protein [Bryobacteraceae bacterium]|jgi:3-hydroxyacyl-CoA dehydrogenase|nr:3-hydroxyacyl-CoA dehydrogenase/enoyl-CoA hydratase family protein [Bryobacteraceae bacterium]